MSSVFIWFSLFVMLGLAGFVVVALVLTIKLVARVLMWLFGGHGVEATPADPRKRRAAICTFERCGQLNPPTAHYCARCGRSLRQSLDLHAA